MGDYFLGEIRMFPFQDGMIPRDWMQCNGAQLNIQQNAALYALIGIQFGGDAQKVFNVPDLRGRAIIGAYTGGALPNNVSTKYPQGNAGKAGAELVALTSTQVPPHTHTVYGSTAAGEAFSPAGALCANAVGTVKNYFTVPATPPTPQVPLDSSTISTVGGGAGHNNMQPYLALNFCIATSGIFPSRP